MRKLNELRRKLNECKKLLESEQLLKSSFNEIIAPSMEFLQTIHDSVQEGKLDPPPLTDEVNMQKVLNTSEKDLSKLDGTLNENFYRKQEKGLPLQESENRTYKKLVLDFVKETRSTDFNDWQEWAAKQPEKEKAQTLSIWYFKDLIKGVPTIPVASPTAVQKQEDYKISDNLRSIIDVCHADLAFTETAETTVSDKYDTIDLLLRRVVRGKSSKRYYILAGDAGIGKTYIVSKILKEEGKKDINEITYTGSIGRSVTAISQFLWEHRNDDILVLDDCDTFLRKDGNPDVINILKGCMEPGTGHKVGIPTNIADRITRNLKGYLKESTLSEKARRLFLESEDFDDEDLEGDVEDILSDEELPASEKVPTSWEFNAKMIIVSNLHESQINEALWSRCDHYDLHLTQEEYLVRLAMIIDNMDIGQKSKICTEEEATEAKALVLAIMQGIIEAGNHGIQFFGKTIRLTDHLEFRIVKDLANTWLAMLERELETHPEEDREVAKKNILPKWVRVAVIPRMSMSKAL